MSRGAGSWMSDRTAPQNIASVHGRGIYLMRTLMDEVRFEERGIIVHMRKSVQAATNNARKYSPE